MELNCKNFIDEAPRIAKGLLWNIQENDRIFVFGKQLVCTYGNIIGMFKMNINSNKKYIGCVYNNDKENY